MQHFSEGSWSDGSICIQLHSFSGPGLCHPGSKVPGTHSLYLPGSGRSQWGCLSGQEEVVMPREAGLSLEACLFKPLLPLSSLTPAWGPWKGQWRQRKARTFGDEITMEVIPSWEQLERIWNMVSPPTTHTAGMIPSGDFVLHVFRASRADFLSFSSWSFFPPCTMVHAPLAWVVLTALSVEPSTAEGVPRGSYILFLINLCKEAHWTFLHLLPSLWTSSFSSFLPLGPHWAFSCYSGELFSPS